ncbi:S8 family peptidase [Polycladidibacter stylochi]|uniref:S8 family peptidase n=1 Tax=Polycladidibacter stylochi TaxID=1807766 RepID=UPI000831188D|nr:S8 family peptidase [Pseudovibrio stylochi]
MNKYLISISLLALAACGGGSGGSGGGSGSSNNSKQPGILYSSNGTYEYVDKFDIDKVRKIYDDKEFTLAIKLGRDYYDLKKDSIIHHMDDINVAFAYSVGLSGKNQIITIIDSYFNNNNIDLLTKKIYGVVETNSTYYHGSNVAVVAAGAKNGKGSHGVAYNSDLYFIKHGDIYDLDNKIRDAARKGSVVQNNSWGITDELGNYLYRGEVDTYLNHFTLEEVLGQHIYGFPKRNIAAIEINNYFNALKEFSKQGVIVFAISNNNDETESTIETVLPEYISELQGKFISVGNFTPYDDNGVSKLSRASSKCFDSAKYCLGATGLMFVAGNVENDETNVGGTSFAAPQVSGGVALLAEAFPSLKPKELVDRLLASANNRFGNFVKEGHVDFGNGVTHDYSREFGHGMMDLRAALLPIGKVGTPQTGKARGSVKELSQSVMTVGQAYGASLNNALARKKIAVFDSLGTDFKLQANTLLSLKQDGTTKLAGKLGSFKTTNLNENSSPKTASFAFSSNSAPLEVGAWKVGFGTTQELASSFGLAAQQNSVLAENTSAFSLAPNGIAMGATQSLSNGDTFAMLSFADASITNREVYGLSAVRNFSFANDLSFNIGLTAMREQGAVLGLSFTDTQTEQEQFSSLTSMLNMGVSAPVAGAKMFASAELGLSRGHAAGLVTDMDETLFTGFSVGATWQDLLMNNDSFSLSISQPMRVESGQATMRVATGRDKQENVIFEELELDLAPEARQFDFGVDYNTQITAGTSLRFGTAVAVNEGHEKGKLGATALARITHHF